MKVALLWPNYWPYIRRGTERMVRDIAHHLAGQGHTVDIITSKPGPSRTDQDGPVTIYRQSRIDHPLLRQYSIALRRQVYYFDLQGIRALPHLLREKYDLIHSFIFIYLPAQWLAKLLHGTPTVYHVVTIPPHWGRRGEESMVRKSMGGDIPVRVFSRYCGRWIADHYGVEPHVVAPTVDADFLRARADKDLSHPLILYTADLAEPAKGPQVLARAFNEVHRRVPGAVLQLAGPIGRTPRVVNSLLELIDPGARDSVQVLGPGDVRSLPDLYAQAAVTVLPSLNEPFGMVLTESLAAGTVAIGSNSGAIPEILSRDDVGCLFERNPHDDAESAHNLAVALLDGLDLAGDPKTSQRCRDHAGNWTWEALGEPFEAMHRHALGARQVLQSVSP